jgi:hypothetical protein
MVTKLEELKWMRLTDGKHWDASEHPNWHIDVINLEKHCCHSIVSWIKAFSSRKTIQAMDR